MSVSKISKNAFLVSLLELQGEGALMNPTSPLKCMDAFEPSYPGDEDKFDKCRKMDVQPDGCIVGYDSSNQNRLCAEPCKPKSTFEKITVNNDFCGTKCRQVYVDGRDVCESIQHAKAVLDGYSWDIGNAVGAVFACAECVPHSQSYGKCTFANDGDGVGELFVENKLVEEHCKQCFPLQGEGRCVMGVDTLQKWRTEFTKIHNDHARMNQERIPAWILITKPNDEEDLSTGHMFTKFEGSTGDQEEFCTTMCHKP